MENSKDFLSKEELNLVTGGVSQSGIFASNDKNSITGPACTGSTCKPGCTGGCISGCIPCCIIISNKDGSGK